MKTLEFSDDYDKEEEEREREREREKGNGKERIRLLCVSFSSLLPLPLIRGVCFVALFLVMCWKTNPPDQTIPNPTASQTQSQMGASQKSHNLTPLNNWDLIWLFCSDPHLLFYSFISHPFFFFNGFFVFTIIDWSLSLIIISNLILSIRASKIRMYIFFILVAGQ
jgi:hypothetical protein